MEADLPDDVIAALGGGTKVVDVETEHLPGGTGAATHAVDRLHVTFAGGGRADRRRRTLIRKKVGPLREGVQAALTDPRHWAWWGREPEAYRSGLLPSGPAIRAPRGYAVIGDTIYLEDVAGPRPAVEDAVAALAAWQIDFDESLDRPWLAHDQLARRIEATTLDWDVVDADPRAVDLWSRREAFGGELSELPRVLSHGDFNLGNLVATDEGVVAFDWATLGWEPVGFDLAHLALSAGVDPLPRYRALVRHLQDEAELGFRCSLALVGLSRLHWMLSRSISPPPWYVDFLCEHQPRPTRNS